MTGADITAIPNAAFANHVAVLGKTGAGKTFTGKHLVERLVAEGGRVCILDPIKSDWWGLTSSADGKSPGLPFYILGGPRGHVPLHASSGKAIAELVAHGDLPLSIIDMADFAPGGQSKFFIEFAPTLLRKMRGVIHLVMEEAHLFAPKERSGVGDENMAIHWAKMLATAGRSKGIRLIVLTQRTQALHNAMLGSCETMIAHRLTAPADQKPLLDWLKANVQKDISEKVAGSLSGLKTGTAWVCSGEARFFELVHFQPIKTYDNSATPDASDVSRDVRTAAVDVDRLRTIVGEAAKEAEANDPKLLKAEIAKLRASLESQPSQMVEKINSGAEDRETIRRLIINTDPEIQDRIREVGRAAYEQGFAAGRFASAQALGTFARQLADAIGDAKEATERAHRLMDSYAGFVEAIGTDISGPTYSENIPALPAPQIPRSNGKYADPMQKPNGSTGGAELRILRVLAARHPAKFTRAQWATLSGMKRTGGTWSTYVSRLRTAGYINEADALVWCTDSGLAAAGDVQRPSNGSVIQQWKDALGSGPSKMIDVLIHAHPHGMDRANLADRVGMTATGGTFQTYLSRLRSNGLIEDKGRRIMASGILFADGDN